MLLIKYYQHLSYRHHQDFDWIFYSFSS